MLRQRDAHGAGHFGADRGDRQHNGIDIVVEPGKSIQSPVNGVVKRTDVKPYSSPSPYGGIEIESEDGHRIKMFYVKPEVPEGARIKAGQAVGTAQDISKRYPDEGNGKMMLHVHIEVRKEGKIIDPTGLIFERK